MNFIIRPGTPTDIPQVFGLIKELALFEKAPDEVINTPEALMEHGFGENPLYTLFVAEEENRILGMALCYIRYSTWKGPCLYLEDIIVSEPYRGKGIGKALFEAVMADASLKGFPQVNWQVLDWNEPAIGFYRKYGANVDPQWLNASLRTPHHP